MNLLQIQIINSISTFCPPVATPSIVKLKKNCKKSHFEGSPQRFPDVKTLVVQAVIAKCISRKRSRYQNTVVNKVNKSSTFYLNISPVYEPLLWYQPRVTVMYYFDYNY